MTNLARIAELTAQRTAALALARKLMAEIAAEYGRPATLLKNLLANCYSISELRRAVSYLPGGSELAGALPGGEASMAELALSAACLLLSQTKTDGVGNMLQRIREDRPNRRDIESTAAEIRATGYTWTPPCQ